MVSAGTAATKAVWRSWTTAGSRELKNSDESISIKISISIKQSGNVKVFNNGNQSSIVHAGQSSIKSINGAYKSSVVSNINWCIQSLYCLKHTRCLVDHCLGNLLVDWREQCCGICASGEESCEF